MLTEEVSDFGAPDFGASVSAALVSGAFVSAAFVSGAFVSAALVSGAFVSAALVSGASVSGALVSTGSAGTSPADSADFWEDAAEVPEAASVSSLPGAPPTTSVGAAAAGTVKTVQRQNPIAAAAQKDINDFFIDPLR